MKTKLVDFDIEKARNGAKVVTRIGERARIVCYTRIDNTDVKHPIVALVMGKITKCECAQYYTIKGEWNGYRKSCNDLMIDESEFEDGDIIAFGCEEDNPIIGIFKALSAYGRYTHCDYFDLLHNGTMKFSPAEEFINDNLRLATEEEKQKLFDALKEDGKCWNSEKKCLEEIARKDRDFKAFERVLVRDNCSDKWRANIFQAYDKDSSGNIFYRCINGVYRLCIPYEGNEEWVNTDKTLKFEY